jgi:hypothetical protein
MRGLRAVATFLAALVMLTGSVGCAGSAVLGTDKPAASGTGVAPSRDENVKAFKSPTALPTFTPLPSATATEPPTTPSPRANRPKSKATVDKPTVTAAPETATEASTETANKPATEVAPTGPSPRDVNGLYYVGDVGGKVVVEEWLCLDDKTAKQANDSAQKVLRANTSGVRVAFHHCPRELTQSELDAAQALEAAGEQGRFWEALTWILSKSVKRTDQTYTQMAVALHLDEAAFHAYRKSDAARKRAIADVGKLEVVAPPASSTLTIDGKPVANLSAEAIEASVQEAMK